MMSLFTVLWLISSSDQVKKAIADYFNDPKGSGSQIGVRRLRRLRDRLHRLPNVGQLKEEHPEGHPETGRPDGTLQADRDDGYRRRPAHRPDRGVGRHLLRDRQPRLSSNGRSILAIVATQLQPPQPSLHRGPHRVHALRGRWTYSNWELSSDRANSARRILQQTGIRQNQISQVRGYADQRLRDPTNPLDPSNRRISLIVQYANPDPPAAPLQAPAHTTTAIR